MDGYFRRAGYLLREGGLLLNHGICSSELDQRCIGDGSAGLFLDRYVFPNGELPHFSFAARSMSAQNFEVVDIESLRPHYVDTLVHWLSRLEANPEEAIRLAGEKRYRIWRAYLAGCAHAFERGWVSVYQLLATKRSRDGAWTLPRTREHIYIRKDSQEAALATPRLSRKNA
jgi:cyclopropane-fatty-acyl-phospholipid synthase